MSKTIIAFYKGTKKENPEARLLDRAICVFTRSRFSHCEIVFDYSAVTKLGYSYSSSPRDGGVRSKLIDFNSGKWELYEVPCIRDTDKVIEFFNAQYGRKYDWFGAIGATIPIFDHNPQKWFCSEIVADCLDLGNPWTYTPEDLYRYYKPVGNRLL